METRYRSLAKAVSYRIVGSLSTGCIVYGFTWDMRMAAGVSALDLVAKIGLYFLHERLWNQIPFGRRSQEL